MDAADCTNDFQDWELLQPNSDSEPAPDRNISFDEINSGALLQADYFSLDTGKQGSDDVVSPILDATSCPNAVFEESPDLYLDNESGEFVPDAEMGFPGNVPKLVSFEGIREIVEEKVEKAGNYLGSAGFMETSGNVNLRGENEVLGEKRTGNEKIVSEGKGIADPGNKKTRELEKRRIVWWKMPMELIKYCGFRMNTALTVSVAATLMGIAILSHRLYKMKKKTGELKIKVTVDDKKVSQAMSRAARLNEAFSVVKRVPVIRTSLPAGGATATWAVTSSR